MPLKLGIASPSYSGHIPEGSPTDHVAWLLERCVEYGLESLQWGGLPLSEPEVIKAKAAAAGVRLVPFWNHIDLVTPERKGEDLAQIAKDDFDTAVAAGITTIVIHGGGHDHFTLDPPLPEQLTRMAENLVPVAAAAAERGLTLGLLPHLDYRSGDLLQVMHAVNNPALRSALPRPTPAPERGSGSSPRARSGVRHDELLPHGGGNRGPLPLSHHHHQHPIPTTRAHPNSAPLQRHRRWTRRATCSPTRWTWP